MTRRGAGEKVAATLNLLRRTSRVLPLSEAAWEAAGAIHARERAQSRDVSLADAILLAQARAESARVLTTDRRLARNSAGVVVRVVG